MDPRHEPADITVKRDESITIVYVDGHEASFDIMTVRLGCPCATCRSLRDRGEDVWPRPGSPTPLRISDAELHGAWGLGIRWNDGHQTGIYPFEALRRWSEQPDAPPLEMPPLDPATEAALSDGDPTEPAP
jgi:DUF971 family protein